MTQLTPEKIADLERVADAATGGPWWRTEYDSEPNIEVWAGSDYYPTAMVCEVATEIEGREDFSIADKEADAEFISTFDPPTVKLLLARVRELEKDLAHATRSTAVYEEMRDAAVYQSIADHDGYFAKTTAERDQLRAELGVRVGVQQALGQENNQLRARVEELEEYQHKYEDLCK